jgi:hypothetical protein
MQAWQTAFKKRSLLPGSILKTNSSGSTGPIPVNNPTATHFLETVSYLTASFLLANDETANTFYPLLFVGIARLAPTQESYSFELAVRIDQVIPLNFLFSNIEEPAFRNDEKISSSFQVSNFLLRQGGETLA